MTAAIDKSEVLRYLGYSGQDVDSDLRARIDGIIAECGRTMHPKGIWRSFPIRIDADSPEVPRVIVCGTALVLPGRDICAHLAGATACALLAGTLGMASERELQQRAVRDPLAGLVFDAACTALIESGMDDLEREVRARVAQEGLQANGRFSPGYGDLPLSVQPMFLDVLQAQKRLGMAMAPTNMMVPAKSVTAVMGLFETGSPAGNQRTAHGKEPCAFCAAVDDCEFRRKGTRCYGDR